MKDINKLHKEAMELAEIALLSKARGDFDEAIEHYSLAFSKEWEAAKELLGQFDNEPSRSVLLRSAASLAMNCSKYREAEQMIGHALSGNPPTEIAEELRDLYEQINFERHLDLRGITLSSDEFQFSMAGNQSGFGIIQSELFTRRIELIEKLTFRTAERKKGRPYREGGSISKDVRDEFEPFLSLPRAASYAVTIRLGKPKTGNLFKEENERAEVIDELIKGIKLIDTNDEDGLKTLIPDEAYYNNFIGSIKELAPDGKKVSIVGLTVVRDSKAVPFVFSRKRKDITITSRTKTEPDIIEEGIEIIGLLDFADATTKHIKLTEENGIKHNIEVPSGMLSDIVKPYWEDKVIVKGTRKDKIIILEDISRADD